MKFIDEGKQITSVSQLMKAGWSVKLVNLITLYRTLAFPVIILFIFLHQMEVFAWALVVSFLTDAVDGYLARRFRISSALGAKLDSIGDDLTVLAAVIGLLVFKREFIKNEIVLVVVQLGLFTVQIVASFIRYGKMSSFHTYLAKAAAVLQAFFLCSMFILAGPVYWLFYLTSLVTIIELVEEIIIVFILSEWKTDVKGLYWLIQEKH